VARANGQIQYVIAKPLPHDGLGPRARELADRRRLDQRAFAAALGGMDYSSLWRDRDYQKDRIVKRVTIAAQDMGAIR
jgi:hypothetical protein